MNDMFEIRLATRDDLEAVEHLRIEIFSSSLGQIPVDVQINVRRSLYEATDRLPEQTSVAFDGPDLIGATSFEIVENLKFPRLKDFSIFRPLGLRGALRLLFSATRSYYPSHPDEAYFYGTAIQPAYRGRGLAVRLRTVAEQQAIHMKKNLAVGLIARDNTSSLKLAKKLGFHEVPVQRNALLTFFLGPPQFIRIEKRLGGS